MHELNEVEKAAVLLIALGPEKAQDILDRLGSTDLMAIVSAMKRFQNVSEELKQSVLLEVSQLLMGLAANQFPVKDDRDTTTVDEEQPGLPTRKPRSEQVEPPADTNVNLFDRLGPLLKDRIDSDKIDWGAAGFDFGEEGRWRRPPEEES